MKKVTYIFPKLHKFRAPFHEELRAILKKNDIEYSVIYSDTINSRQDTINISWGIQVPVSQINFCGITLLYQHALEHAVNSDLIIVQQENKLLINYLLQGRYLLGKQKIAFFGHGKNFQSRFPNSPRERFKRFLSTKVHWWFAYTDASAQTVKSAGFPLERITVFNNSIDTSAIRREVETVSKVEVEALRRELGIGSDNVGIYVGGMYKEKRLDFLIEAALLIRSRVIDFHLLLVGAGDDAPIAVRAATEHDFIHYLGPKFGREKTVLAMLAKVFLMPGLVGLAVLDSFAYGLPIVTTDVPYHSPEIDYLEDGKNGIIVPDPDDTTAYAVAVAELLTNENKRNGMINEGRKASEIYTIENMAALFAEGVIKALDTPPHGH
jgi:glycosyltransferase involved in cell wall biosynthesis